MFFSSLILGRGAGGCGGGFVEGSEWARYLRIGAGAVLDDPLNVENMSMEFEVYEP